MDRVRRDVRFTAAHGREVPDALCHFDWRGSGTSGGVLRRCTVGIGGRCLVGGALCPICHAIVTCVERICVGCVLCRCAVWVVSGGAVSWGLVGGVVLGASGVAVPWGLVGGCRFGCVWRRCAVGMAGGVSRWLCWQLLRRVMSCRVVLCRVVSCRVVPRHLMLLTRVVDKSH